MNNERYCAEFVRLVGLEPSEAFLARVQAAGDAGMDDEELLDALRYEAQSARSLGGIYARCYGEERGREKACEKVYQSMKTIWMHKKRAVPG